ncbi:MAG: C25 family cysteine peptidase [Candidatus Kapabacteria bacterium]|nr:C25 family cysteine peptidase [Candidatus Kapabacteria bacterium]
MKIIKFITIFLFFVKLNLFSSTVFIEREDGLKIYLNSLEFQLNETRHSQYLVTLNSDDSNFPSYHNFSLPDIRFQIAIPQDGFIKHNFENFKLKKIGSFDILKVSELVQNYQEKLKEVKILEPELKVERIGILRGLPVAIVTIQPFYYNSITQEFGIIDSVIINIEFSGFSESINTIPQNDFSFYSFIKNKNQISRFYSPPSNFDLKKSNDLLLKTQWYNPEKRYVRLITKSDGIASIKASEILAVETSFNSLPIKNFILWSEVKEERIFISDNGNEVLDADDVLYFLGSRAKGDTTWFENYTDEASFFLTYDDKKEGLRYQKVIEINASKTLNYVEISRHIEIERKYHRGFPQDNVEIVPGEGWFWEILEPKPGPLTSKNFIANFEFYPYPSASDSISIELNYKSSLYDITVDTNKFQFSHLIKIDLNNNFVALDSLKRKDVRNKEVIKSSNDLIQGINQIQLESIGFKKNDNDFLVDQVGFDFIKVKGKSEPVFTNTDTPFGIPNLSENSSLEVLGFSLNNVLALDTTNGLLFQPETKAGSFISLSTAKDTQAFTSFRINDSLFTQNEIGFSIGYLEQPEFSILQFRQFLEYSTSIENFINSIPNQSIIFILFNGFKNNADFPLSLKNSIKSLGSKLADNISKTDIFGLIIQKGKPETLKEQISKDGKLSLLSFIEHQSGKSYKAKLILKAGIERNIFLCDDKKLTKATATKVNQTDLFNSSNQADLLIITHPDFLETANKLKEYRQQADSTLRALVIDVNDIYKEFYFGKKSPHAIKEFLKHAYYNWNPPKIKYVTLVGDASWDARMLQSSTINKDFIPTYGWPASDYWYGLLEGDDLLSEIVLGRIPIKTNQQGLKYVEKVIEYETVPNDRWMKRFLLMSGGTNDNERASWYSIMKYTFAEDLIMKSPALCADTMIINKKDPKVGGEGEAVRIISEINKGADWVAFLGHGSPVVLDMDGWQAEKLNNKGRYGFFSTLSCNTSAFAEPDITARNEDYVLVPDRGFVGAGGSSNLADQFVSISLHLKMLQTIANPDNNLLTYPEILNNSRNRMISGELERFLILQYTYLGDPMIKLRMIGKPDIYINPKNISIATKSGNFQATENDSILVISGTIDNIGYKQNKPFRLLLTNLFNNNPDTSISIFYYGLCYPVAFKFELNIAGKPGKHNITISADPDRITDDKNFNNNTITINQEVFSTGLYPLEPQAYWNVKKTNPRFRFINPLADKFKFSYDFKIFDRSDNQNKVVKSSSTDEITENEGFIEWNTNTSLESDKLYYLYALNIKEGDTNRSSPLLIPFYANGNFNNDLVEYKIWDKELRNLSFENLDYDSKSNSLKIKQRDIPIDIIGIRGKEGVFRASEILFDNEYVITTPPVQRGFNIVTFNDTDPTQRKIRWFETWDDINTITNENSEKLVRFLRDTVQENEYVAIATCDEAMQVPIEHKRWKPGSIGSIDTLISTLKEFGSKLADSLDWGISFAMLGKKGLKPGEAIEDIDYTGDTARVSTFINYKSQTAKIIFPTINGFKSLSKIKIDGNLDSSFVKTDLILNARTIFNKDTILSQVNNKAEIDLINFQPNSFMNIQPILSLSNIDKNYFPAISSLSATLEPAPELFLSKTKSGIENNNLLRGDTAKVTLTLKNISLRSKSKQTRATIYSISQIIIADTALVQDLNPDEERTYHFYIPTTSLSSSNLISLKINNPQSINEFYVFNNSTEATLKIIEDKEKPTVRLFLDGVEIKDGDYTSLKPRFKVQLFDNSSLQISNPTKLWVRINGIAQSETNTQDYKFQSFGNQKGLKAELSFLSESFEYKQNNIHIYFEDAAGNKDTAFYRVFVSQNGIIDKIKIFPNPSKDFVNVGFYFKSPVNEGTATLDIFNINGQKLKTITFPVKIGTNLFIWDLFDDYNNKIPVGAYLINIRVQSEIYVEPQRAIFFRTE